MVKDSNSKSSSHHLSSSLLKKHKARQRLLHLGLSLAASSAALQLSHPISFLSFSAVLLQVSLGLPLFCLPSGVQVRATFCSSSFPFLRTCLMYCHLLSFMLFRLSGFGFFPSGPGCWFYLARTLAISSSGICFGMPHTSSRLPLLSSSTQIHTSVLISLYCSCRSSRCICWISTLDSMIEKSSWLPAILTLCLHCRYHPLWLLSIPDMWIILCPPVVVCWSW